jgi:hypothetical protein
MVLFSCGKVRDAKSEYVPQILYDVSVTYSVDTASGDKPDFSKSKYYSTDSVYLFVEYYFENDSLLIFVNDNVFYHESITTDPLSSSVGRHNLGAIRDLKSVSFTINSGPLILLNTFPTNFIILRYEQRKEAKVLFERRPRIYY